MENLPEGLVAVERDLPEMPKPIIEQWLGPYVKSEGWPPRLGPDGVPSDRWRFLLGLRSLAFWRRVRWELRDLPLQFKDFEPHSKLTISELVDGYVLNRSNQYSSSIPDRRVRFQSVLRYLVANGVLPVPVVLLSHPEGYSIMDGNHRVAALCAYREFMKSEAGRAALAAPATPPRDSHGTWIGVADASRD